MKNQMRKTDLLIMTVSSFGILLTSCGEQEIRPNILWIVAEDLSPDLGCYGNSVVSTPNIDRLAADGILFQNVFVAAPVCSPSRSAMITGCYQTSIKAHNHRTLNEEKPVLGDSVHLLSKYFNDAGYYTILDGNNNIEKRKNPGSWGSGKTDYNFNYRKEEFFKGNSFDDLPNNVPFFCQLTLKQIHRGDWWKLGEERDPTVDQEKITIPPFYPDHPITRESFAAYYDAINILDQQVGVILDNLDSLQLLENTVVVFTSDHGRAMPRAKQFCYDQGIHVPLIISGKRIEKGKKDDRLLSSLDVSATLTGLAGIKPSGIMHGKDFMSDPYYQREYIVAARDRCDETVFRIRALRTKEFKYIRNFYPGRPYTSQNRYKDTNYPILGLMRQLKNDGLLPEGAKNFMSERKPEEELYDLKNDPFEINNLAANPEYLRVLDQFRSWLNDWMENYTDYGQYPEPDSIMEKIMIERINKYGY